MLELGGPELSSAQREATGLEKVFPEGLTEVKYPRGSAPQSLALGRWSGPVSKADITVTI